MTIPRALIGSATDGRIMLLSEGHEDIGAPVDIRATTNPLAPAGAAMDCSFDRVYVTTTRTARVHLRCTPIVDGEHVTTGAFDIELPQAVRRQSHTHEQVLTKQSEHGDYKEGLRGRWFQLEIDSVGGVFAGDLILDEVAVEWEPLSPTRRES